MFADLREVFDLFDFWDGRDGLVDGIKIGDFLRCSGVNPTVSLVKKVVGAPKDEEECAKFFGKIFKFCLYLYPHSSIECS